MVFRKWSLSSRFITPSTLALVALLSACTNHGSLLQAPSVQSPSLSGPEQNVADYKDGESRTVVLDNQTPIQVQRVGDKLLYRLEGTFTQASFTLIQQRIASKPDAERREILKSEIDSVFESAKRLGAIAQFSIPEVGYFQFMLPYESQLTAAWKKLKLENRSILLEPIAFKKNEIKEIQQISRAQNEELFIDPRSTNSHFSGLERIGAIEFVKQAEQDIGDGVRVDGSSVQIGVADSGITYNHPTFLSRQTGKVRINHIQDFTGEGTIFINSNAKFSATAPDGAKEEDLTITAEYIETPQVPTSPVADNLKKAENLKIKVNAEQRALLLATNASGAKLGVINEEKMGSDAEPVDMNGNGKNNDLLYVLYLPASGNLPERVYFDSTGSADFRKSPALSDFNKSADKSKDTMRVFAEKIGFAFRDTQLPDKEGKKAIPVRAVSFVGYDPGNHGSHVSGIAAGSKTISNDSPDTLARGVAPEAQIALARVCSNNAGCSSTAGLADLVVNAGAEVVNMSLGGLSAFNDGSGVSETLINRLVSVKNAAFIISAGNSGPGRQTVGSPSVARLSLSIGATASRTLINRQYQWPAAGNSSAADPGEDFMLFFSSRGPTASGGFKPNLSAPGTELSSVQLNSASGVRGGLDVYWGTSMAAPTVTGAYALFLDAVKKYNAHHPATPLTTDAMALRRVLIESARPFDVSRVDLSTGEKSDGQYTWADQGTGMIDLKAAWKKVFALRDSNPPTAVTLENKPVELDYEVVTSMTAANGNPYDGSEIVNGAPVFGSGVYLKASSPVRFKSVYIARKLPESFASGETAGELTQQLKSTADTFALRTVLFGSKDPWLKAGVMETADCLTSTASDLTVIGQGVAVGVKDGEGTFSSLGASSLNICFDREKITQLPPGDHGALIYGYRKVGAQTSPVASFIVPVFLSVPQQTLTKGSSLKYQGKLPSFGVDRHYVMVPPGTSVLKIALSVPPVKTNANGDIPAGETCSGVELMAYEGLNTAKAITDRADARVGNCNSMINNPDAAPILDENKRQRIISRTNPRPGLWDVHVFGQYRFPLSQYDLKVDYVTGETSVDSINGGLSVLSGSLSWKLKESSFEAKPDAAASAFELKALKADSNSAVAQDGTVYVESPLGALRSYPENVSSVTIEIGQSPGNDIDLYVMACPDDATAPSDGRCSLEDSSTGSTDEESVTFKPKAKTKYAVRIEGATVKGEGKFVSSEELALKTEKGNLEIKGDAPQFDIAYSFDAEKSELLKHPLFTSGKYHATGSIKIRMADNSELSSVPVTVKSAAETSEVKKP